MAIPPGSVFSVAALLLHSQVVNVTLPLASVVSTGIWLPWITDRLVKLDVPAAVLSWSVALPDVNNRPRHRG